MKNPLSFLRNRSLRTLAAFAVASAAFASLQAQPATAAPAGEKMPFQDASLPIEARVKDLLGRLTLEEKVYMTHGHDNWQSGGIPRLGLPPYVMDDGPLGVRDDSPNLSFGQDGIDYSTAMPAAIGLAATWNPKMAFAYGNVIGEEAFRRGKFEMLGPSLNIQRTPLNGRNFEYMGEDPFLTSQIAVGYIHGEQSKGVVASTAKHFAGNNQETARNTVDAEVDLRTLHEIYLPAFKAAVQQGGVLAVMGSYNFLNGVHACENDWLLNKTLKDEWGFKGLVVSDWGGVHDTKEAALNGMDIEMAGRGPDGSQNFLGDAYLQGLKDGTYPMSGLDDKVSRIAYVMIKLGLLDVPSKRNPVPITADNMASTKAHQDDARQIESEAIVLLKNDSNILPLDSSKIKTIAVIGDYANRGLSRGGGSATIKSPYEITALDAIKFVAGKGVTVNYAQGFAVPQGGGRAGGGGRGGLAGANPVAADPDLVAQAVAAAKAADVVIYVGGLSHDGGFDNEGTDRANLKMPWGQDDLLAQVTAANPKTVVVLYGGGALEMPWVDKVPGLLYAWYPGIEGANALAQIIFGYVDPSGKLPCTFPKQLSDTPTAAGGVDAYPGIRNPSLPAPDPAAAGGGRRGGFGGGNALIPTTIEHYSEKLLVGYRWYDTKKIEPLFPFGYGLSYTKFEYKNLKLVPGDGKPGSPIVTATFDITNTGAREGMEVAELYIHQVKSTLDRPEKELKGFSKIDLKPGETQTVSIPLDHGSFAYFDPDKDGWVAEAGDFNVIIGSSSRDPRLNGTYTLAQTSVVKD